MPITASIDVVARDKELLDLSTGLDIMPPESSRFRVVIDDPVHFIDSTFHVYDVIFVEPPLPQNLDADRLFSYEFYKDAYRHLADGGVFATALPAPYGYTRESIAELHGITAATMRKVFPKVIFAPGTTQIAIGGGMNITSDLDTLDARAAGLMAETGFFPEGLLVILHSQVEQQAQTQKIIGRSIVSESNRLFSAPLLINYWRRHPVSHRCRPQSIFCGGLIIVSSTGNGSSAAYCCCIFCCAISLQPPSPANASFSRWKTVSAWGAVHALHVPFPDRLRHALPYAGSFCRSSLHSRRLGAPPAGQGKLPASLAQTPLLSSAGASRRFPAHGRLSAVRRSRSSSVFAGLSGGVVLHETIRRTETANSPVTLWSMELAGAASGILLAAFLVIADHGFIFCIALLMLSRVAHLFAKS